MTDSTNPVSPKVNAGLIGTVITGGLLTVAVAAISAIGPELFEVLGPWGPVVFAGVSALGGWLAGYQTKDPRRQTG